ncbi:F-box/kelch-repeat protein At1g80440 [Arachis ipaensis]|uniref:F-box/kelch-repeat protein At1g80440 n=1 Tax=Arachis ipaensis TaxID=130454 RepID=UPI0007AF5299|nr:F-box/kelch-repeat protein At1g80440 [Arachis ipaensis]
MELISALPEDVARDCLIRISYQNFPAVSSVSKAWNTEIQSPEFRRRRTAANQTQKILVAVQSRVDSDDKRRTGLLVKAATNPVYQLSVLEPKTGNWSELPPAPELPNGLPMFCRIAGVGYDLVVIGGWDPESWKASNSVFIYNFLSATWRRGADMPGGPRTFFACASDNDRTVYVAGGHDDEKNALKSVLAYDVARDAWAALPDMSRERDECKAIVRGGRLCIIGGYCTEMQGRFEKSSEEFDAATCQWSPVEEEFLDAGTCPRTCVDGGDDELFICRDGEVVVLKRDTWQTVVKVPEEIRNVSYMEAREGALLLIGSSGFGQPHMGFLLDLKSSNWAKLSSPENYTGHVQFGCLLEI